MGLLDTLLGRSARQSESVDDRVLNRYELKGKTAQGFKAESVQQSGEFTYYFGSDSSIGVRTQSTCEANTFMEGFLVDADKLVIVTDTENPKMMRESYCLAAMKSGYNPALVTRLIELFKEYNPVHAYVAREEASGTPMLVFSKTAPSEKLYAKTTPMQVRFKASSFG